MIQRRIGVPSWLRSRCNKTKQGKIHAINSIWLHEIFLSSCIFGQHVRLDNHRAIHSCRVSVRRPVIIQVLPPTSHRSRPRTSSWRRVKKDVVGVVGLNGEIQKQPTFPMFKSGPDAGKLQPWLNCVKPGWKRHEKRNLFCHVLLKKACLWSY